MGDEPSEVSDICEELAHRQVEDVPLSRIDTRSSSTSAQAQAATSMAITTGAVDLLPSKPLAAHGLPPST